MIITTNITLELFHPNGVTQRARGAVSALCQCVAHKMIPSRLVPSTIYAFVSTELDCTARIESRVSCAYFNVFYKLMFFHHKSGNQKGNESPTIFLSALIVVSKSAVTQSEIHLH